MAFSACGANIFTVISNHFLKAVGTYARSINCSYEIYIFTNVASGYQDKWEHVC
ncbi:MAG: lectin like domain-containing protein [Candidatus Aminicenantia bacterium]